MPSPVGALTKIKKMYSPLEKAVVAHKLESMPSAQWQAYIKANAPKAAKKEALAVKLDELLARQPKVTKAEIVQHIKDNSPKIKTKLLKNDPYFAGDVDNHMNIEPDGMGGYNYLDADGQVEYNARNAHDMAGYLNSTEGAKYGDGEHTLPGGQNYQEMLLSLPRNPSQAMIRLQKVYEIKDANGQLLATGQLPMSPRTLQKVNNNPDWVVREFEQPNPNDLRRDPANFQSGHYDDPNILAHVRMNDRPTAEGKKALFLEELQSDWAQQGRKEGFDTGVSIKYDPGVDAYRAYDTKGNTINLRVGNESFSALNSEQAVRDALANSKFSKGIPRAPYVEDTGDWTALSLKKAIEHAVEQGHDSIAWTTGAQQADRYNLAKQLDRVQATKYGDEWAIAGYNGNAETINHTAKSNEELANVVGKDLANKIIESNGGEFSGVDLQVGGEGMKGYYDQIVPSTANDILKSMGVTERVKPIGVQLGDNVSEQMGFEITPEIRDYVMNEGLPAFAGGGIVKAVGKGLRGMAEKYRLAHEVAQKNAVELLGLPPDNTAMDRAKAMGYIGPEYHTTDVKNIDNILNDGFSNVSRGARNFSALGKDYGGKRYYATGVGNYTSDNPFASEFTAQGQRFADQVMLPLMIKKTKHFDYNNPEHVQDLMTPRDLGGYAEGFGTAEMNPSDLKALQEGQHHVMEDWITTMNMKKRGYTGTNLREPQKYYAGEGTTTNTFDNTLFRSKFAAFDPMRRNENDLLAGVGVGLPVSGMLAEQPLEKAEGGAVHMDNGGLWEGYGAPVDRDTQKRQSAYYPEPEQAVHVMPSGAYSENTNGDVDISRYTMGADIDILNKYGFGVTKQGGVVKLPERSYTFDDGYTETQPARKIKRDDISELRVRYTTDDGVQYGVGRQPLAKGWSGYRSDPRSQSSVGVSVSPYYKGINYTKNFAKGGEVDADSVDYDELYEFKKAEGGVVDWMDEHHQNMDQMFANG